MVIDMTYCGQCIAAESLLCGDIVFDLDGSQKRVLFVSEMGPVLEVQFSDGSIWGLAPKRVVQVSRRRHSSLLAWRVEVCCGASGITDDRL
jgi:hypothetical protein